MLHDPVTTPPLTLRELRDMLARYQENADISKVIKNALEKRLTDDRQSTRAKSAGLSHPGQSISRRPN
jgi:hypothetical protein